jgi:hypothetical protein
MDISGWTEFCENKLNYTDEQKSNMLANTQEIEDRYDKEDEDMMIRLIKIRKTIWS